MPDSAIDSISFTCRGHKNVLAAHRNTLVFTRDAELSTNGDCIVGVSCDFDGKQLAAFAKKHAHFTVRLESGGITDVLHAESNPSFNDSGEIVMRFGGFISGRTLGINSDKSAKMLKRELVEKLKSPESVLHVEISSRNKCNVDKVSEY